MIYFLLEYELEFLDGYLKNMYQIFQDEYERSIREIKLDDEPAWVSERHFREANLVYWENVKEKFVISFIMLLFSFFDRNLRKICNEIKKQHKIKLGVNDIQGGLVERTRKYLSVLAGFRNPDKRAWKEIDEIYTVRNMYTHSEFKWENVVKPNDKKNLESLYRKKSGVKISEHEADPFSEWQTGQKSENIKVIKIYWDFCYYSVNVFKDFFNSLKKEHLMRTSGNLRIEK